jgi:hypothetical protein
VSDLTWNGQKFYTREDIAEIHRKIRIAKEAREFARVARAGKPIGFRRAVGR